jgi:lysophospholipase L1-like esterase
MMQSIRSLIFVGLSLFGLLPSLLAETTVLALGDSITEGGSHFVCYRATLPDLLQSAGVEMIFVGPKKDGYSAHAGYSGKNTAYLASIIDRVYRKYPADVVLLHSGHNSFSKDQPVPGIIANTDSIVNTILAINPDATVLIAQVIEAGKLPKYSYIPELNDELANYVRSSEHAEHLVLVDQATGFDWHTDTIEDHVHPNALGGAKKAQKWCAALSELAGRY